MKDKQNTLEYSRGYTDGMDGDYDPPKEGQEEIRDYQDGFNDGEQAALYF